MFSWSSVEDATRRALASGALQPIETETTLVEDAGVRFIVRAVSSLARKGGTPPSSTADDPLGDYDPNLFVGDAAPSHYILLNKFPVVEGHILIVTRHYEPQERLLAIDEFVALAACLNAIDGLGFYNGGTEAGASQPRKHLQLVPLPLARESADAVPMERLLCGGRALPFVHAFSRLAAPASPATLHSVYRELLARCGTPVSEELQSAPYNLLVLRNWMLLVPRSSACFERIPVNALGFAGSLFVRSPEDLARVGAVGPMQVLREVAVA